MQRQGTFFLLFRDERSRHADNASNQQPGLVFYDPTEKLTCNWWAALAPNRSGRSPAARGHPYLHGATFWLARGRAGSRAGVSLRGKGMGPWEHIGRRLERSGCKGQKGSPWEQDLACIQCSVLHTEQSGGGLPAYWALRLKRCASAGCQVYVMFELHKWKNYLDSEYFKIL